MRQAGVLAWKISLSLSFIGGQERWYKIAELWSKTEGSDCVVTPLTEMCKSIAYMCATTTHGGLPLSFVAESTFCMLIVHVGEVRKIIYSRRRNS
jgi:hypothetical protein